MTRPSEPAGDSAAATGCTAAAGPATDAEGIPILEETVESRSGDGGVSDIDTIAEILATHLRDQIRTEIEQRVRAAVDEAIERTLDNEDERLRARIETHLLEALPRLLKSDNGEP